MTAEAASNALLIMIGGSKAGTKEVRVYYLIREAEESISPDPTKADTLPRTR
jgi:hypothetical protein